MNKSESSVFSKPKFKMSKEEMLDFNDDCERAACLCPQYYGGSIEDRQILLGGITAKELVKWWSECKTLFDSGYEEELSQESVDTFKRYKLYKIAKKKWKLQNEHRTN